MKSILKRNIKFDLSKIDPKSFSPNKNESSKFLVILKAYTRCIKNCSPFYKSLCKECLKNSELDYTHWEKIDLILKSHQYRSKKCGYIWGPNEFGSFIGCLKKTNFHMSFFTLIFH